MSADRSAVSDCRRGGVMSRALKKSLSFILKAKPRFMHRLSFELFFALFTLAACAVSPPNTNPHANTPLIPVAIDLTRYMGRWYIIGNIPYLGENHFVGSYVEWALRRDGKILDAYVGRKEGFDKPVEGSLFIDKVVRNSGNGNWTTCFTWLVCMNRLSIFVDPDYQYTIVSLPDKSLVWIMARNPEVSGETYATMLARLDALGFDIAQVKRVPQFPKEIGQPGFQSPGR